MKLKEKGEEERGPNVKIKAVGKWERQMEEKAWAEARKNLTDLVAAQGAVIRLLGVLASEEQDCHYLPQSDPVSLWRLDPGPCTRLPLPGIPFPWGEESAAPKGHWNPH